MISLVSTMAMSTGRVIAMLAVSQSSPNKKHYNQNQECKGAKMLNVIPVFHTLKLNCYRKVAQVCVIAFALVANPASAQEQTMEVFETTGDTQVTKVEASNVCFATINTTSKNGAPSFFATYKLKDGDRWQVTGHSGVKTPQADDILTIRFDGEGFIVRELQRLNNTFPVPFTEDTDLAQFDALVATGTQVSFDLLRLKDSIIVDLESLRAAKVSVDRCLETIK
jgi:hypothetical protein